MSLTKSDNRWLILRSAILPLLFILPFFLNHFYQFPCPNPDDFRGPCYAISSGGFLGGWIGFIVTLMGIGIIFTTHATWQRGKGKAEFAKKQLYYALLTVTLTAIAYAVMYQFSEGRLLPLLDGISPPTQATLAKVQSPPLGVSFPPSFLAVFSLFYLIAPTLQWLTFTKDKKRVAGIKKRELFQ